MGVISFKTLSRSRYITCTQLHQLKLGLANSRLSWRLRVCDLQKSSDSSPVPPITIITTIYLVLYKVPLLF